MDKRKKAYLALLTTTIIWGFASPVIKFTLGFIPPFTFLFWRFLLTTLIFLPVFFVYKRKKKIKLRGRQWLKLAGLGFLGTSLSLSLLFIGYNYTTAIDGILIYSIVPIMVIIGGGLFLKEEITKQERIGAGLAFSGSLVTVIQPALEGKTFALQNIEGNLLILLSAIVWASYCLMMRKTENQEKTDPLILTALSFFVGLVTIIPLFLYETGLFNPEIGLANVWGLISLPASIQALGGIFYMAVFSSVIAYFTYNLGFSLIEASEATLFDYLKPVFGAPLAVIWLGEKITLPFLAGAGLIFLGVFLTEYKRKSII